MENKPQQKFKGDTVITFDDVPLAINAEKALKTAGFPSRLVAPPPEFRLGCALGLEILSTDRDAIVALLKEKSIAISRTVPLEGGSNSGFYNKTVLDHFRNPRNVGVLQNADAVGHFGNESMSIEADLYLRVRDSVVTEAKSRSFGCGATIASGSIVTEMVKGKTLEEAADISNKAVAEALGGLPANKMHCSNLAADALHLAIQDYLVKSGREGEVEQILKALPKEHEHSSH